MKIIVDMNMGLDWVAYLRERGHEVEHWSRIGAASASDEDIMTYCADGGAVILSNDLDFGHMHAVAGSRKPSVVQVRSDDVRVEALGHQVARALSVAHADLASGAVVTVKSTRVRVSKLPIGNLD